MKTLIAMEEDALTANVSYRYHNHATTVTIAGSIKFVLATNVGRIHDQGILVESIAIAQKKKLVVIEDAFLTVKYI